jgi:hypothetical protein
VLFDPSRAIKELATSEGQSAPEPCYGPTAPRRLTSSPIIESTAAFKAARRLPENNFFGCPHHKHVALATVAGLPHAEQTFARRI